MVSLDVTSRAYEAPVLARFALELCRALTVLDGELLVLLPGMKAVMEARSLCDSEVVWPAGERDRLTVSSLAMQGAPPVAGASRPAAVVLVGLTPPGDADDPTLKHAREWMSSGIVTLCINPRLKVPPVEMRQFEAAYCLMTYTVARTDKWREDGDKYQEDAGTAVLWRRFPRDWTVMVDHGNLGDWTVVEELPTRPDEDRLSELLLPGVQQRQAVIDSTKRALGESDAAPPGGGGWQPDGKRAANSVGGDADARKAAGGGVRDAAGVVTIDWAAINAPGSFGPNALYSAVAMHRFRALGADACCEPERDARGMHVLLTEVDDDARAAWEPTFGKMRGGLTAACQLVPDGVADGVACLEQLAVRDGADEGAAAVISRALTEARAAGQYAIVALAPASSAGSTAADALRAAGFGDDIPARVAANVEPSRLVEYAQEAVANANGQTMVFWQPADVEDMPAAGASDESGAADVAATPDAVLPDPPSAPQPPASRVGAEDAPPRTSPSADAEEPPAADGTADGSSERASAEEDADEENRTPGASEADIERLKRMFGGELGG